MNLSAYTFSFGTHHNKNIIWISFPYNTQLLQDLKTFLPYCHWSKSKKCWYVMDRAAIREKLNLHPNESIFVLNIENEENKKAIIQLLNQLKLKAYSPHTIKTYLTEFSHLLKTLKNFPVQELTQERLKDYFLYCIKKEKIKELHLNQRINAIKFYFEQVLHQPKMFFDIPRPKSPLKLPKVLSKSEIKKIFLQVENPKHLLMLKLAYGMGMRVSEIVKLKITDIDSMRMLVLIESAKGKKDRYVVLPSSVLELLRNYYIAYKPKFWLFEGQYGGQYAVRSVQAVFKNAMQKAKINKKVGVHGLRHSYATHLLEQGADIRFIQELMGHNSIKTTQIYTHVSTKVKKKISSPLDNLM